MQMRQQTNTSRVEQDETRQPKTANRSERLGDTMMAKVEWVAKGKVWEVR